MEGPNKNYTYQSSGEFGPHFRESTYVVYNKSPWYSPFHIIRRNPRNWFSGICCCLFFITLIIVLAVGPGSRRYDTKITALETILIDPETIWHSGVEVETAEFTHVVSYKFANIPPYSDQILEKNLHHQISIDAGKYEYWSYRLTKGAKVVLSYSVNQPIDFLIIKGSSIYELWARGNNAVKTEKRLFTNQLTSWQFDVNDEDVYYFIWDNSKNQGGTTGESAFYIKMVTYDFSKAIEVCSDHPDCYFSIKKDSEECVIIYALDSIDPNDVYIVRYYIHPRLGYYWTIFGILLGVFAAVVIVIFIIVIFSSHSQKQTFSEKEISAQPFLSEIESEEHIKRNDDEIHPVK